MRILRTALLAAVLAFSAPTASSAEPLSPCPDGQGGKVVTVDESTSASICARVQLCGFVLGVVYGVVITVNGETLVQVCPDTGPTHFDPGTLYWLQQLDPIVCPLLASAPPGVPGIVDIGPWGDLYVLGFFVWDCPPYVW